MAIEFELGRNSEEVRSIRLFGADIYLSNIDAARMRRNVDERIPDSKEVRSIRLFGADIYPSNIDAATMMRNVDERIPDSEEVRSIRLFGADIYPSNINAPAGMRRNVDERIPNPSRNNIAVHGREIGLGHQEPGDVLEPHGRWKIQKDLSSTDVDAHYGRLLLPKGGVEEHILPLMDWEMAGRSENPGRVLPGVRVVDVDSNSIYDSMKLTQYSPKGSYYLNGSWNRICKDRGLQRKDKVGLYWDPDNQELRFSVLERGQAATRI